MKDNDGNCVVFAKVFMFRPDHVEPLKGFGFAETEDGKKFFLPMSSCRKVVSGSTAPEFSYNDWKQWPCRGDEVVILPDLRPPLPGKFPRAGCWGYRRYWDSALSEIKNRPIYRVVGENLFKWQKMNGAVREDEIAVGTLEELQAKFPSGVANDPLGTNAPYRSGPCQRINRWQVWRNTDFAPCDDPRSRPNSPVAVCNRELEEAVGDSGDSTETESDKELAELARLAGGRRAGTTTLRPGRQLVSA